MPMKSEVTAAAGSAYIDIRAGAYNNIHQQIIDVSALAAAVDADGYLPPGLPLLAAGGPVTAAAQTATGVVGPEAVELGSADHFGNVFKDGPLNKDAIEDNLGRALSADELSALAAGGFTLI